MLYIGNSTVASYYLQNSIFFMFSLNAKDKDGKTLLHLAVEMKRLDLVQILVSKFYAGLSQICRSTLLHISP